MRLNKNNPTKSREDFDLPSEPVVPPYPGSSVIKPPGNSNNEKAPSAVVGPKIVFKGELSGEEDLLIQGTVEGTVNLKGNQLVIGKQGVVKANITAKVIIIEGTVEGDVIGEESIAIKASSDVKGNLMADRITLEDGAKFRGSVDMESKTGSAGIQQKAPASTPSASANSAAEATAKG